MSILSDLLNLVRGIKNDDPTALSKLTAATSYLLETQNAGDVPTTRTITAGTGLTGGGDLSADRTLSVDTTTIATRTFVQGANKANFRNITAASDTVATSDVILLVNHAGAVALSLPALGAPGAGLAWVVIVQDVSGAANSNNITITPATTINGSATYVINTNYGAVALKSTDGSIWFGA